MQAIVSYTVSNYGCQLHNGKLINTSGGGSRYNKTVNFEHNPKLTNEVSALKAFLEQHEEYQFGNSVKVVHGLKVESIDTEA